jgi:hypothetical protein
MQVRGGLEQCRLGRHVTVLGLEVRQGASRCLVQGLGGAAPGVMVTAPVARKRQGTRSVRGYTWPCVSVACVPRWARSQSWRPCRVRWPRVTFGALRRVTMSKGHCGECSEVMNWCSWPRREADEARCGMLDGATATGVHVATCVVSLAVRARCMSRVVASSAMASRTTRPCQGWSFWVRTCAVAAARRPDKQGQTTARGHVFGASTEGSSKGKDGKVAVAVADAVHDTAVAASGEGVAPTMAVPAYCIAVPRCRCRERGQTLRACGSRPSVCGRAKESACPRLMACEHEW